IQFIELLCTTSLDDPVAKLDDAALHRLWNPPRDRLTVDDDAIRFGIESYFALEHSAISSYKSIRQLAGHCFKGNAMGVLSYYSIKKLIAEYTGVELIEHDMCPDTCIAFTGPYATLDACPICGEDRYDAIQL
ncbi:hypothetical protein F5J12DRAFT_715953, partial [Pisolithus orientalis]|uniref:uncharacterized protein n=1 Tax=Pisolithus orientalis TaxID=936130 RepID=UPI002224EFD1